jgi:hypothetical protein
VRRDPEESELAMRRYVMRLARKIKEVI